MAWPAGNIGLDLTGNGLNANSVVGSDVSQLWRQTNQYAYAPLLQGGDGLKRTTGAPLSNVDNLTLETWLLPTIVSSGNQAVIQHDVGGGGYDLLIQTSFEPQILLQGVAFLTGMGVALSTSFWSHVVIRRQATQWTYFLNGRKQRDVETTTPNSPAGSNYGTGQDVNFQRYQWGLAAYDRPLSENEIFENYQAGITELQAWSQVPIPSVKQLFFQGGLASAATPLRSN